MAGRFGDSASAISSSSICLLSHLALKGNMGTVEQRRFPNPTSLGTPGLDAHIKFNLHEHWHAPCRNLSSMFIMQYRRFGNNPQPTVHEDIFVKYACEVVEHRILPRVSRSHGSMASTFMSSLERFGCAWSSSRPVVEARNQSNHSTELMKLPWGSSLPKYTSWSTLSPCRVLYVETNI